MVYRNIRDRRDFASTLGEIAMQSSNSGNMVSFLCRKE